MPISVRMEIKRSFVIASNSEFNAQKLQALRKTAADVQAKAKALAAKPTGWKGRGVREGKLVESIKVSEPYASESGKSTMIRVYADTDVAKHVPWQEAGTGEYGPLKKPIKGKMAWTEKSPPYRGRNVWARGKTGKTIPRLGVRGKRGEMKTVFGDFDQFATEIHGSKPKWFMRDAGRDPKIKDELAAETRRIARNLVRRQATAKKHSWALGFPDEI